ncbi:hypothetical protein BGZ82_010862 [Podila clonocystis]|nr:hypothetical protein BGZ82_010862 [Podila clonocystis]
MSSVQSNDSRSRLWFAWARLLMIGTGNGRYLVLPHSRCVFISKLVYANPLMELHLEHIQFEDRREWELISESVDPTLLKTLGLVKQ